MGDPGGGSYANLQTKSITLDPKHLKTGGEARFVAAHEGAHIGETLSLEQLGRKTAEQKRVYKGLIGLHPLVNVIEDGAINDRFCKQYPNLQSDTLSAYPRTKNGDPIGIINLPEVRALTAMIGRPPLYARALAGILADWSELRHVFGFGKSLEEYQASPFRGGEIDDPKLQQFLDVTLSEARRAMSFIPAPHDPASKSFDMGLKRFAWCEKVLYPELKKLVDEDLKTLKEAIKGNKRPENKGSKSQQGHGQQGQGEQATGQQGQGQQRDGHQGSGEQSDHHGSRPSSDQSQSESADASKSTPRQNTNGGGAGGSDTSDQTDHAEDPNKGDPNGISDTEAGRRAAELLAQAEDAIRSALESLKERAEGSSPTATEVIRENNNREREAETGAMQASENATIAQQLRDALLNSLSDYHREYHKVASSIEEAHNRLMDVFDPERHFKWQQDRPTGSKLNMVGAMRFELTSEGHERMWEQRIDPQYPDQDIVIIIDRSGSMQEHDKFVYARRAVLFARELFQRLHIPTACVGFADSSGRFLDFEDDIGDSDAQDRLMQNTAPLNEGTNDASAIEYAASLLKERSAIKRTIIMISDAQSGTPEKLKQTVQELAGQGIPVLHFGIGAGTGDNNGNYIHSKGNLTLANSGPDAFLEVFCKEMERLAEGIFNHPIGRRDV